MESAPQPEEAPETAAAEEALEFKPWVKATAWSALILACFATSYHIFYHWGYDSALQSARAEAEKSVAGLLQLSAADDAALLQLSRQHAELFSSIADPAQRREAQGALISALADRGLLLQAEPLLDELMPPAAPASPAWGRRMLQAARSLAAAGKWAKAKAYLDALESAEGQGAGALLRERAELLSAASLSREELVAELEALAARAAETQPALCAELHVYLGKICRELGENAKADAHFQQALAGASGGEEDSIPRVCCGVAYYEVGNKAAAEEWLKSGVDAAEPGPESADLRAIALRHLATLSLESGRSLEALGYLHRAEGEAAGRIPADSSFWLCLGDQRAWTLYTMQAYEESLEAFRRVLAATDEARETLRAQPLEGVVRCCLALGQPQEAIRAAQDCLALRERALPQDKESLGRVYVLLGQACDQAGDIARSAEAYGRAVAVLPPEHGGRAMALEARAYALMQAQQWEPAVQAWEAFLSLLPADDSRREKAQSRLETCQRRAEGKPEQPETPAPQEERAARRRSRR